MTLRNIRTDRFHQHKYWFQIVYEWEDVFSQTLNRPLVSNQNRFFDNEQVIKVIGKYGIYKLFQLGDRLRSQRGKDAYFDMGPRFTFTHAASANVIPIIIDFWKNVNIERFAKTYANAPMVCISSLEALEYLKQKACPLNLQFLPLSLPDKYEIDVSKPYKKKYDFVVAGRPNPVLQDFLLQFSREHEAIEYVTTGEEGKGMFYTSNKRGIIGPADTREQYLEMIKSARIAFYNTPGIDGGEKRTGGFNPVTPRLFELLYAGCYLIGRYPKTIETDYFKLPEICPAADSYEQFKALATRYLSLPDQPLQQNKEYLKEHYTSKRAAVFQQLVTKL